MAQDVYSPFDLSGQIAIVTGADRGLGQGLALGLAAAGANILLAGRSDATDTMSQIEAMGQKAHWVYADLSSNGNIDDIIVGANEKLGVPTILVNNAGSIKRHDAVDFPEDDWDFVMDTNLKSAFFLAQAFAKNLFAAHPHHDANNGMIGKIINIASMLSFQGGIRVASYTASKSGLAGITKLLANEWAAKGICVNAIAPGYMATDNTAALQADPVRNRDIMARIPAGRWGNPQDLAGAAVFLASAASDYVQGVILPVDGGWQAR